MRHVVLDEWARRSSILHRVDARWKIVALFAVLILITIAPLAGLGIVLVLLPMARVPILPFLLRSLVVIPFVGTFVLITYLSGEPQRALALLLKSWASALAVLLVAASTPLPSLLGALHRFGVPAMLLDVVQFIYRYLFLLAEQAHRMRLAAQSRGGSNSRLAASGTLAVLFARSYQRAEGIQRAILSRK